ncbi:MAG: cytidylate kinase family protein, partial [Candidatus Hecatellaceae archaeon]
PDEVRFKRIAQRDGLSLEEARRLTLEREKAERERYRRYYGIDLGDLSVYDIILNTELLPLKANIKVLTDVVREYVRFKLEG